LASITERGNRAAGGILTFVLTPFAVTGVFRLFHVTPTLLPFLAAIAVATWLWFAHQRFRSLAAGVGLATIVHATFLVWLFRTS
jgi:hypothetical protein